MNEKYTDEFLISEFYRFKTQYGRYPLTTDFRKNKNFPNSRAYERRWGSWRKFIDTLGVLGENGWYKEDEELVKKYYPTNDIQIILGKLMVKRTKGQIGKYANKLGLYLVAPVEINKDQFIIDYKENKMSNKELAEKYNCTISTIHKFARDNDIAHNTRRWTKEKINFLKNNYEFEDWTVLLEKLHPFDKEAIIAKAYKLNVKRECFGWSEEEIEILNKYYGSASFEEVKKLLQNKTDSAIMTKANKLGLTMREKWSTEDVELLTKLYPYHTNEELLKHFPNRTLSSISSMGTMKLNLNKSPELLIRIKEENRKRLLEDLIAFSDELGRTPSSREISDNKDIDGISSYIRYFGSYTDACIEAGLPVNQGMYLFGEERNPIFSKNNDTCLSYAEKVITDFMVDNHINYKKSETLFYKNFTEDERFGTKRFDWLVEDKVIVEYFGMIEKDFYKKKTEEKLKLCSENNINIIALYPEDIRNSLRGVKEKLAPYINNP